MRFVLRIDCKNDAFATVLDRHQEIARLLRWTANKILDTDMVAGILLDKNGKRVGEFGYRGPQ